MAKAEFEADAVKPRFPRRRGREPGCQLYRKGEICGGRLACYIEGIAVCQYCLDLAETIRAEALAAQQSRIQERMRAAG